MAKIRIVGDSSGYVEIAAPNAAGNNTLELPSGNTRLVGSDSAGNVSISGIVTATTFSGNVNSTSGVTTVTRLNVGTNGSVITTTAGGLVGMGTTNPQTQLEIFQNVNTVGTSTFISLNNPNSTGQSSIEYKINGSLRGRIRSDYVGNLSLVANGGDFDFYTGGDSGIGTNRMKIRANGEITAPYQPAFMVRGDGSGSIAPDSKFAFTKTPSGGAADGKVCFDRANNWSDADDRFTAPVAGVYQFIFGIYRQAATSTTFSMAPRINGAQVSINDTFMFFTSATGESSNTDDGMYGSFYMNLSANDYVELFIRTSSTTINWYGGHTFFGGHLVG